jgi:predicted alternative tryptophan synthase beta-subunit
MDNKYILYEKNELFKAARELIEKSGVTTKPRSLKTAYKLIKKIDKIKDLSEIDLIYCTCEGDGETLIEDIEAFLGIEKPIKKAKPELKLHNFRDSHGYSLLGVKI